MPSSAYEVAKVEVKFLTKAPSQNQMLELYGLAKIAEGVDIKSRPAPGMFDFVGKEKNKAWQKLLDEKITDKEAETKYIELVEKLKADVGTKELSEADKKELEDAKAKGT